ncbi:MAG: hypothetical protein AMXMBFR56_29370 [Polyangiaceae bacterium]
MTEDVDEVGQRVAALLAAGLERARVSLATAEITTGRDRAWWVVTIDATHPGQRPWVKTIDRQAARDIFARSGRWWIADELEHAPPYPLAHVVVGLPDSVEVHTFEGPPPQGESSDPLAS